MFARSSCSALSGELRPFVLRACVTRDVPSTLTTRKPEGLVAVPVFLFFRALLFLSSFISGFSEIYITPFFRQGPQTLLMSSQPCSQKYFLAHLFPTLSNLPTTCCFQRSHTTAHPTKALMAATRIQLIANKLEFLQFVYLPIFRFRCARLNTGRKRDAMFSVSVRCFKGQGNS